MKSLRWIFLGVLTPLLIAALAATIVLMRADGFSTRSEPSSLEVLAAAAARTLAMPVRYRELQNPLKASPENIRAGMEHFANHCATCHANDGDGDTQFGKGLYPKPPDLRKARTQNKSDGELYYVIENGIRLSGMPAFGQHSGTDEVESWHLVDFIRRLPTLTDKEVEEMASLNPKTDEERREEQEEQEFLHGSKSTGTE